MAITAGEFVLASDARVYTGPGGLHHVDGKLGIAHYVDHGVLRYHRLETYRGNGGPFEYYRELQVPIPSIVWAISKYPDGLGCYAVFRGLRYEEYTKWSWHHDARLSCVKNPPYNGSSEDGDDRDGDIGPIPSDPSDSPDEDRGNPDERRDRPGDLSGDTGNSIEDDPEGDRGSPGDQPDFGIGREPSADAGSSSGKIGSQPSTEGKRDEVAQDTADPSNAPVRAARPNTAGSDRVPEPPPANDTSAESP